MNLKKIIGISYRALIQPARREVAFQPLRAFFRWPVVYDVISLTLQLRDISRVRDVNRRTDKESDHHHQVHEYNAAVTQSKLVTTTRRAERYYRLLALQYRPLDKERLLIVGPRNVQEIFTAWTYGWKWNNIEGIDLYSTNPKIAVMNMEKMLFPDARFDVVSMAHTLSYANDTHQALSEVARILRPGGWFAFSATYDPHGSSWKEDKVDGDSLAKMLHSLNFEICVHFAIDKMNAENRRQTSHDFLVRLVPSDEKRLDPFRQ